MYCTIVLMYILDIQIYRQAVVSSLHIILKSQCDYVCIGGTINAADFQVG